jgi:hypothetical protein
MRKVLWAFAGLIVVALGALGGVLALDAPVKPPDIEFPLAWVPVIGGLPVNGVPCKHINLSAAAGCCLPLGAPPSEKYPVLAAISKNTSWF